MKAELALPESRYPGAPRVLAVHRELLARLRAVPGIRYAATTTALPFSGQGWGNTIAAEGRTLPPGKQDVVQVECISTQYLPALGIRLRAGRDFEEHDTESGGLPVAILNESLARRLWPGASAIGRRIQLDGPWRIVVGVANDVRRERLDDSPEPQVYIPYAQLDPALMDLVGRGLFLVARSAAAPASLAAEIRTQVRGVDPDLAVTHLEPMADAVADSVAQPRFRTLLIGVFSLLALALAGVGVYGVTSYTVVQRTQEIGVRMALGASVLSILGNVLRAALAVALAGTAVGCLAALAVATTLRGFLYGVAPSDPLTFAAVAALLIALTLLASYIPARRASLIDPNVVLRRDA
jgi:putative ABC transport system permease protein